MYIIYLSSIISFFQCNTFFSLEIRVGNRVKSTPTAHVDIFVIIMNTSLPRFCDLRSWLFPFQKALSPFTLLVHVCPSFLFASREVGSEKVDKKAGPFNHFGTFCLGVHVHYLWYSCRCSNCSLRFTRSSFNVRLSVSNGRPSLSPTKWYTRYQHAMLFGYMAGLLEYVCCGYW